MPLARVGSPTPSRVALAVSLPPAPDSILTRAEVAEWLKVRPRQVERLGVPVLDLGPKTKRYLARDVIAWLDAQRQAASRPGRVRPHLP
jgi:hypothetical protein